MLVVELGPLNIIEIDPYARALYVQLHAPLGLGLVLRVGLVSGSMVHCGGKKEEGGVVWYCVVWCVWRAGW